MGDRDKGTRDEGMWGMGQGRRGWGTREQGQGDMDGGRGDTERGRGDGDSVGDKGTGTRDKETGKDQVTGGGQDRRGTGGDKGQQRKGGGRRDGERHCHQLSHCHVALRGRRRWHPGDVTDGTSAQHSPARGLSPMRPGLGDIGDPSPGVCVCVGGDPHHARERG